MQQHIERIRKKDEDRSRRYISVFIHWEVVVKTMETKVHGDTDAVIREIPNILKTGQKYKSCVIPGVELELTFPFELPGELRTLSKSTIQARLSSTPPSSLSKAYPGSLKVSP